jgi:hypothetical protein
MRSLQKALQQDPAGRRIIEPSAGPLFAGRNEEGDEASGTVYVLRSKSDHPTVVANRELLHKIGVTGGDVVKRIGNARLDPTYLMADVEIVEHTIFTTLTAPNLKIWFTASLAALRSISRSRIVSAILSFPASGF